MHILDPCNQENIKETKDTFHSKIDECFSSFFDEFKEINKVELDFRNQVVLQQFIKYLKQYIGGQ